MREIYRLKLDYISNAQANVTPVDTDRCDKDKVLQYQTAHPLKISESSGHFYRYSKVSANWRCTIFLSYRK